MNTYENPFHQETIDRLQREIVKANGDGRIIELLTVQGPYGPEDQLSVISPNGEVRTYRGPNITADLN